MEKRTLTEILTLLKWDTEYDDVYTNIIFEFDDKKYEINLTRQKGRVLNFQVNERGTIEQNNKREESHEDN
jgi:hypothetical protein